jgi:hypothetical protein
VSNIENRRFARLSFPRKKRILDGMPKKSAVLPPIPTAKGIPPLPPLKPGAKPVKKLAKVAARRTGK